MNKSAQAVSVIDPEASNVPRIALALNKVVTGLPGKQTGQNLLKATRPPGAAWIRTAMRLSVALLFYMADYVHLAQIVAVLAAINLVGAVEVQIAKVALETWQACIAYAKRLLATDEDAS